MTMPDLVHLVRAARVTNEARAVTGLLLYSQRTFLQLLEGAQDDVEAIMARIRASTRHTDINAVFAEETKDRMFPTWSMGLNVADTWWPASVRTLAGSLFRPDPEVALAVLRQQSVLATA